jgi:hypothetical protein
VVLIEIHLRTNNIFIVPYVRLQLKLYAEISIEYVTETTDHKLLSHVSDLDMGFGLVI